MRVRVLSRKAPRGPGYQAMPPESHTAILPNSTPPHETPPTPFPNPSPPQTYPREPQPQSYQPDPQPAAGHPSQTYPGQSYQPRARSSRAVRLRSAERPAGAGLRLSRTDPSRTPVSPIASSRVKPTLNRTLPGRASPIRTTPMRISPTPPSPTQASPTPHIRMQASPRIRPRPTSAHRRTRGSASMTRCISTMGMRPTATNPAPTLSRLRWARLRPARRIRRPAPAAVASRAAGLRRRL